MSEPEIDQNDYDKDDEYTSEEEADDDYRDYYSTNEFDYECAQLNKEKDDPEYFEYNCLTIEQTKDYLNRLIDDLCNRIDVSPSIGKVCTLFFIYIFYII